MAGMRIHTSLIGLVAAWVFAQTGLAAGLVKPAFDAQNGTLRATLAAAEGAPARNVVLPPVLLDGVQQDGFSETAADPAAPGVGHAFTNKSLRVVVEPLPGASAAISWTTLDNKPHDFVIIIEDNSSYYGCGERFSSLNHKGHILSMASIDHPSDKGDIAYKPVPFFMSSRGYAAWMDSTLPGEFDLNATHRERVFLRYRAAKLRLVLIDGPTPAAMLDEFTRLTGRPRVPPAWSFAPWKSRDVHKNRDEVLEDAEKTRDNDLPGSVIVIDSPWETGYNNFVVNEQQFSDAAAMFARLTELGFVTSLWLTPFINSENVQDMKGIDKGPSSNFAEAEKAGFLVKRPDGKPMIAKWWKGKGGLVDFTNPAATAWWHSQLEKTLPTGARSFKCDDGESNFVQDAVFHDGSTAAEMKGRYAQLYLQAAQDFLDKHYNKDGVLLARPGFTGTQQQPFCWAGDNYASFGFDNGLPTVILAGQNAALSGLVFWGHDIAGYVGEQTPELFARWTQFGAFSPLMQVHMKSNTGAWDYDTQTLAIYRKFAKLHTCLWPYINDAAQEAAKSGMPIIRPMVLAFPNDPKAVDERFQYMFGPDILVAPMFQSGTHRSVYLPKQDENRGWIDYWTGEKLEGGRIFEVEVPLDRMPLFVRSGAIIPMLPEDVDTLLPRTPQMAAGVVAIDDRRVIQIWGAREMAAVHIDGLSVEPWKGCLGCGVTITSDRTRDVTLMRIVSQPISKLEMDDGWHFDETTHSATRTIAIGEAPVAVCWPRPCTSPGSDSAAPIPAGKQDP
jgi:alpha-D-xyloside xylohydrolase